MSNDFDKEVAAKIAEKLKRPELDCIPTDDGNFVYYKNFQDLIAKDGDNNIIKDELRTEEVYEPKEMSKIDFYRQKVRQYEDVETLIQSIECELEDVEAAKSELCPTENDYTYNLNDCYAKMDGCYKECLGILRQLLKII